MTQQFTNINLLNCIWKHKGVVFNSQITSLQRQISLIGSPPLDVQIMEFQLGAKCHYSLDMYKQKLLKFCFFVLKSQFTHLHWQNSFIGLDLQLSKSICLFYYEQNYSLILQFCFVGRNSQSTLFFFFFFELEPDQGRGPLDPTLVSKPLYNSHLCTVHTIHRSSPSAVTWTLQFNSHWPMRIMYPFIQYQDQFNDTDASMFRF